MGTKYDWSNVPKDINWIATDSDGMKCHYKNEPKQCLRSWHFDDEEDLGDCFFDSTYANDWKNSLEKRPVEKN